MKFSLDMQTVAENHLRGFVGEECEQERPGKEVMKKYKGKWNFFCKGKDIEVTFIWCQ